jgi:hypothetical protein
VSATLVAPDVAWQWDTVPGADAPADEVADWLTTTAEQLAAWTEGPPDLATLPPELRAEVGAEVTPEAVGRAGALWLLARSVECPPGVRLVWGAGFVDGHGPRWAPLLVVVDFRAPLAPDPSYLMETVGTRGAEGDARPPVVDYVTTELGDGIRVTALVRDAKGVASCRADAAVRADVPAHGGRPAATVDIVLSARSHDLSVGGVLGAAVEELMHLVVGRLLPGPDGEPGIVLAPAEEGTP